jgi:GTP pyrophosphokinase
MLRLNDILDKVASYHPDGNLELIEKSYVFSAKVHRGQTRLSGEPYLSHPLEVANILADLKLDEATIVTGLLHDILEDTCCTPKELEATFGKEIGGLVNGLTKISRISFYTAQEAEAENFRRMILAMAKDIRVIIVKLADRVHNMRTLEFLAASKREAIAQETLDIYAPLANRLGIASIKTELEDLSLRHLKPDIYYDLVAKVAKKKRERERYIEEVKEIIDRGLKGHEIVTEVFGRPKHFYSIYKKMETQNIDFDQIYDLIAFRIIVDSVSACYGALGIIHALWKPVPGRFKDYIALPRANMYQSLHTTVIGPYGERVEIQIRTPEMHRVAEIGIAAHWKYKEGLEKARVDSRFDWLRQMVESQSELKDAGEFLEMVKVDLFPDEVYVFTPKGDVRQLPAAATPIDFAYSIHTEVGHHCTRAKVNGKLVPLKHQLQNGDTVEIVTSPNQFPSKDWLKLIKTSRARSCVRQWMKVEERSQSIALGTQILEKEFKKHGLSLSRLSKKGELDKLAQDFSLAGGDDLLVSLGNGRISSLQVLSKLLPEEKLKPRATGRLAKLEKVIKRDKEGLPGAIEIKGMEDLLVRFAKCCHPLAGDRVVGFITRGRGVSVHRVSCASALSFDPERKLEVQWYLKEKGLGLAKLVVVCADRIGLLAELSSTITGQAANIARAQIRTAEDMKAINTFEVEVESLEHLQRVMKSLEKVEGVIKVDRLAS